MSRCTLHTRRKQGGATCSVCRGPIDPGQRYRQRIFINEDWTERDYERRIAHDYCVSSYEEWRLFKDPPPWKPPPVADGVTAGEHHILLHCLGMQQHIPVRSHGHRKSGYFHEGKPEITQMVEKGLMVPARKRDHDGDCRYYLVTRAGGAAVGRPDLGVS